MYHVWRFEWGDVGCNETLQEWLDAEDSNGFWLDRIVPVVYDRKTGKKESVSELIVITGDHVLQR